MSIFVFNINTGGGGGSTPVEYPVVGYFSFGPNPTSTVQPNFTVITGTLT